MMSGMPDTTPNTDIQERDRSADASEQSLAQYRAHPTTDNLTNCVLAHADAAAMRIEQLSDRLAAAEDEIKALKDAAAPRTERPRLRAGSPTIPTAPRGG
jgi:hypothetical protein